MNVIKTLLDYVSDRNEIENSVRDIDIYVIETFRECCRACFEETASPSANLRLKIDSVVDYLHEELHTGHWCDVPVNTRAGFTAASFVKAIVILGGDAAKVRTLSEALKCLDMGILLGAPLDRNCDLMTKSAKHVTKQILQSTDTVPKINDERKRKRSDGSFKEYDDVKAIEVDRQSIPSLQHFLEYYLTPEKPIVITDSMTHWPACQKWNDVNYLLTIAGERNVPIEIGSQYSDENWSQKIMSFKEFVEKYYLEKNDEIGYLAQHNLLDQIPELKDDVCIPEYCCTSRDYSQATESPEINAWFGPKGTVSSLHYDPKDNILAQIFGTKLVLLFSPSDSDYLYPHDSPLLINTAQVDPVTPDLVTYPQFKEATMYKCLLSAGDMLYMPPKWWHYVTALEKSFSVNFWWS